jgi:hypothetical protein
MTTNAFPTATNAEPGTSFQSTQGIRTELRRSLVLNAAAPFGAYQLAVHNWHMSQVGALLVAAAVPTAASVGRLVRGRAVDLIGVLALVAVGISLLGVAAGGGASIVLLKDSFLTGALSVACFASLLMARPLMFHFVKRLRAGDNAEARAAFDAVWERADARRRFRLVTVVWGTVYAAEVAIKVGMVVALPAATVLAAGPVVTGGVTLATIGWTIRFFQRHAAPSVAVAGA